MSNIQIVGAYAPIVNIIAVHNRKDTVVYSVSLDKDSLTKIVISDDDNLLATYDYETEEWWFDAQLTHVANDNDVSQAGLWLKHFEEVRNRALHFLNSSSIAELKRKRWRMPVPDPHTAKRVSFRRIVRDEYDDGMVVIEEYSIPKEGQEDHGWSMIDDGFDTDVYGVNEAFKAALAYASQLYHGACDELGKFDDLSDSFLLKDFSIWYRVYLGYEYNDMTFYLVNMNPDRLIAYSLNIDDDWSEKVIEEWGNNTKETLKKYHHKD